MLKAVRVVLLKDAIRTKWSAFGFSFVQVLGLTTTPGKTRDLGDHILMNVKATGMNHKDLT